MLYRFREAMLIEAGLKRHPADKSPLIPSECISIAIADTRRRELVKEISRKVSRIQDASMEEFQVRALNDEINKLIREKLSWDQRIRELGGIERRVPKWVIESGALENTFESNEYMYFGRARELPEVKAILEPVKITPALSRKRREELYAQLDDDYYGKVDDTALLEGEARAEAFLRAQLANGGGPSLNEEADRAIEDAPPIPTQRDVEAYIVKRKQKELLGKYGGLDSTDS